MVQIEVRVADAIFRQQPPGGGPIRHVAIAAGQEIGAHEVGLGQLIRGQSLGKLRDRGIDVVAFDGNTNILEQAGQEPGIQIDHPIIPLRQHDFADPDKTLHRRQQITGPLLLGDPQYRMHLRHHLHQLYACAEGQHIHLGIRHLLLDEFDGGQQDRCHIAKPHESHDQDLHSL